MLGKGLERRQRKPAAAVLGPLLLTVLASFVLPEGHTLEPLYAFKVMAFLSIGWVCGGGEMEELAYLFSYAGNDNH